MFSHYLTVYNRTQIFLVYNLAIFRLLKVNFSDPSTSLFQNNNTKSQKRHLLLCIFDSILASSPILIVMHCVHSAPVLFIFKLIFFSSHQYCFYFPPNCKAREELRVDCYTQIVIMNEVCDINIKQGGKKRNKYLRYCKGIFPGIFFYGLGIY